METQEIDKAYERLGLNPPRPNGGWFTGESFENNGPIPIIPDSGYIIHYSLRSANPPKEALYQYPSLLRPGNNYPISPGINKFEDGKYDLNCISPIQNNPKNNCKCMKCKGQKYYYV